MTSRGSGDDGDPDHRVAVDEGAAPAIVPPVNSDFRRRAPRCEGPARSSRTHRPDLSRPVLRGLDRDPVRELDSLSQALGRPLVLGVLMVVIVQLVFSGIAKKSIPRRGACDDVVRRPGRSDRRRGDLVWHPDRLTLVSGSETAEHLQPAVAPFTRMLNVVAVLTVGIALVSAAPTGPSRRSLRENAASRD